MNKLNSLRPFSPSVLRIGISLIIIWFGSQELLHPAMWISFLPGWVSSLPISQINFIYGNGIMEVTTGLLLLIGLFNRVVSFILAIHMLGIIFTLGYNAIAMRDFAIFISLVSIFFNGEDRWSLFQIHDISRIE